MTGLGAVLGWKHNHEPGIRTEDGVITAWPSTLGALPTQTQIDTWTAEYAIAKPDVDATRDVDASKALKAVVVWAAGKLGVTPAQARDEIITIYKGL